MDIKSTILLVQKIFIYIIFVDYHHVWCPFESLNDGKPLFNL